MMTDSLDRPPVERNPIFIESQLEIREFDLRGNADLNSFCVHFLSSNLSLFKTSHLWLTLHALAVVAIPSRELRRRLKYRISRSVAGIKRYFQRIWVQL